MSRWPIAPLGSVVRFISGGTPSKDEKRFWDGDIPWVSSAEMTQRWTSDTRLKVTEAGAIEGSKRVPKNTVLVVVRGMSLAKEFRVSISQRDVTFNQDVKAALPSKGIDPVFLFFYLLSQSNAIRDSASEAAHGTKKLDMPVLEQWPIPVPPIATQNKIAAILSAYDDLIANNQRRITLLERMAEDIYREWFVRLRFPGHQGGKLEQGLPQGWRAAAIGEVFKTASGGIPSRTEAANFGGEIPWIKTGELKTTFAIGSEETVTQQGIENSAAKVYKKYTVIMAMYCAMPDLSIIANDAATNQACCAFSPRNAKFHHSYCYFLIKFAQLQLVMFAHGAAQQNLSQEIIKKFPVLLPSEDLVVAFGMKVGPIFDSMEALMRANLQLKATRDALLPRLISGKLAVDALDICFPPGMSPSA